MRGGGGRRKEEGRRRQKSHFKELGSKEMRGILISRWTALQLLHPRENIKAAEVRGWVRE
jgi:hypothetical protein